MATLEEIRAEIIKIKSECFDLDEAIQRLQHARQSRIAGLAQLKRAENDFVNAPAEADAPQQS